MIVRAVSSLDVRALETQRAEALARLQHKIDYRFHDQARLDLALTHSSVAHEEPTDHSRENNEQLEFLGDAVLGLVVTEYLFRAYPELNEGVLTRVRAQFVSRQHLAKIAQRIGLGEYLRLGKGEEKSGGRRKSAILANTMEALIAAVYLDGGAEEAGRLVRGILLDESLDALIVAARSGEKVGDYKSSLQEYLQANGLGQPKYQVTAEAGPDHRKSFVVAVKMTQAEGREQMLASAGGSRKKHAEQEAARLALQHLRSVAAQAPEEHMP